MKEYRLVTLRGTGLTFTLSNDEDEASDYQGYLTDLKGWFGGVGVHGDDTQRTLGHGFFPQPSVRTGRELTVSGTLLFKDEQTRMIADRFLSGLLWDGDFGELEVTTNELTLTCRVKLAGEISHEYYGTTGVKVQIPLTAPDPFLYAPVRVAQIFPAGFGEGLVYPLFSTKMTGTPDPATVRGLPEVFGTGVTEDSSSTPAPDGGKVAKITATTSAVFFGSWGGAAIPATLRNQMCRLRIWVLSTTGESVKIRVRHNNTAAAQSINQLVTATAKTGVWTPTDLWIRPSSTTTSVTFTATDIAATSDSPIWVGGSIAAGGSLTSVLDWGAGTPLGGAITNTGNATAYPKMIVRGSWPAGFTITAAGKSITYPAPVTPASPVEIDTRTGEVLVRGVDNAYLLTSREWPKITPGSSIQPRITGLATSEGWVDVQVSSTYI